MDNAPGTITTRSRRFLTLASFCFFFLSTILQVKTARIRILYASADLLGRSIRVSHWDPYLSQMSQALFIMAVFFGALAIVARQDDHKLTSVLRINRLFFDRDYLRVLSIVVSWIIVIAIFAHNNINNPNFWYDESGQFWIAKGLNHYSLPFEPAAGLHAVLVNNSRYNLDPGGFSILLHFWSMVSNTPTFLRILPFLFFVSSMIIISRICLIWFPKNVGSYYAGMALLVSGLLKYHAFELRPYSAEMFTVIVALLLCYKTDSILNNSRYAILAGASLGILMTSRYSTIFSIGAVTCIIFIEFIRRNNKIEHMKNISLFCLPIFVSATLIFFIMLRNQNPGGDLPDYVRPLMFRTGNALDILFRPWAFATYVPFMVFLIFLVIKRHTEDMRRYRVYVQFVFILNGFFIIMSVIGKYPWSFDSRWDIATHAMFVIAIIPLSFSVIRMVSEKVGNRSAVEACSAAAMLMLFCVAANGFVFEDNDSIYDNWECCFRGEEVAILANMKASPTIRYLFEYGPLNELKNVYSEFSWFDDRGLEEPAIEDPRCSLVQYDYVILSHYENKRGLGLRNRVVESSEFLDCSIRGPSLMFKRF